MSDVWADALHVASFAFVELDVLTGRDSIRRALARHSYPRRDGGDVQDQGADPRSTDCRIIFFEREPIEGESDLSSLNHLQRYEAFFAAAMAGFPQEFVHPITGSYNALVEDLGMSFDAEEPGVLLVDCRFVEDATDPAPLDIGVARPVSAGVATVEVEVEALNAALDAAGLESSVGDETLAAVAGWESDAEVTARLVTMELQSLSSKLAAATDELELATRLDRHPVWRALQRLHNELRRAAQVVRQSEPALFELTTTTALPLRVLAADLYGAHQAERRRAELMQLNDIDDPGLIPSGTTLVAPTLHAKPRQGLRSASR